MSPVKRRTITFLRELDIAVGSERYRERYSEKLTARGEPLEKALARELREAGKCSGELSHAPGRCLAGSRGEASHKATERNGKGATSGGQLADLMVESTFVSRLMLAVRV